MYYIKPATFIICRTAQLNSRCMLADNTCVVLSFSFNINCTKNHRESLKFYICYTIAVFLRVYLGGRDSSVGIATRYGLDGPGIES